MTEPVYREQGGNRRYVIPTDCPADYRHNEMLRGLSWGWFFISFANVPRDMAEPYLCWHVSWDHKDIEAWGDEYEVVPPEQWPDEFCAVIARWRLSGERHVCE